MHWPICRATLLCRSGASAATESTVAALVAASDDGGSRPIKILIQSGRSGGSGNSRGDSGGGTVRGR